MDARPRSRSPRPSPQPPRQASRQPSPGPRDAPVAIPPDRTEAVVVAAGREVRLTNLDKPFWPELGIAKRDLLQYYADVAPLLLPHVRQRAMVMKRYPNGASGAFFFMKRAPSPRPEWIRTCSIEHESGNVIAFPVVDDLASLLWVVNLGCIDLNPWYSRCDDTDRPDYLHFDLDPTPGAGMDEIREVALILRDALGPLGMPCYPKTTGSRGLHIYIPIERGPTQKQVWTFAKRVAQEIAAQRPAVATAEYRVARRPPKHVLVDYNQNAWGRTLASVYSVRPTPRATVSTPLSWDEVERGVAIEEFRLDNVRARLDRVGDLWAPVATPSGRFRLPV